jgi:hypothetical protein
MVDGRNRRGKESKKEKRMNGVEYDLMKVVDYFLRFCDILKSRWKAGFFPRDFG